MSKNSRLCREQRTIISAVQWNKMENLIIIAQLWTPLHYSVAHGHYEISKLIIDEIEINNLKTPCGWTLLHIASKVEICQLILERVTGDLFLLCQKKLHLYLLHCNNQEKSSLRSNLRFILRKNLALKFQIRVLFLSFYSRWNWLIVRSFRKFVGIQICT